MDQMRFFDNFMPHGMCYAWNPQILLTHVISDAFIAFAYFCIPFALYYFFKNRRDFPFRNVILMFSVFIFTCGLSHIMGIVTVWNGAYGMQGLIKAATAIASLITAAMLIPLMPQLLALRSPRELEAANMALTREMDERVRSEERNQRFVEAAPDAVLIVGKDLIVQVVNSQAVQLLAQPRSALIGKPLGDLIDDTSGKAASALKKITSAPTGKQNLWTSHAIRFDGALVPIEVSLSSVGTPEQQLFSLAIRDISRRVEREVQTRALEEQVAHVDRLDTMGLMAAGLAHEINQPLMAMSQNAETAVLMLEQGKYDNNELEEVLSDIQAQAHRAGDIIKSLRQFVGNDDTSRELFDLHDLLRQTARLVESNAKQNGVEIRIDVPTSTRVFGARVQIAQVFVNLLKNSIEAMVSADSPLKKITIMSEQAADFLQLSVQDTGPGIETSQDVFTPFQSAKNDGMGMGLSICKAIIVSHGGDFKVDKDLQEGAGFFFTLPMKEV